MSLFFFSPFLIRQGGQSVPCHAAPGYPEDCNTIIYFLGNKNIKGNFHQEILFVSQNSFYFPLNG